MKRSFIKLQTIVQRIAILLLLLIILGGMAAWWLVPDINRMRPQIESLLKQELQLSELQLQGLSWYWAGHIGFEAEHCSFKTANNSINVDDTKLTMQLSLLGLLRAELWPKRITLSAGKLAIHAAKNIPIEKIKLPPTHLIVDAMQVQWQYASYHGELKAVTLDINTTTQHALLQMPGFRLSAALNEYGQLRSADWTFNHTAWLPDAWQAFISGTITGEAHLQQIKPRQWQLKLQSSAANAAFNIPEGPFQLPFEHIASTWDIQFNTHGALQQLDVSKLVWQQAENKAIGHAQWKNGKLSLQASSPHLNMPLLWSWLHPLDQRSHWQDWLDQMQTGVASNIQVSLSLPWQQPLQALPQSQDWQNFHYRVTAKLDDMDIYLGLNTDKIDHIQALVEVNEQGLQAQINQAQLPNHAGTAQAQLSMPWDTQNMNIQGTANTDIKQLQGWLTPSQEQPVEWLSAPANATVQLEWNPLKLLPHMAHISIQPSAPWHLLANQIPITITSGQVIWDIKQGLYAKKLMLQTPLLHGSVSFHSLDNSIQTFQSQWQGNFSNIVAHYHIPIADAQGELNASINFADDWHGKLDFKHARWSNLLGSQKKLGQAMLVSFQGDLKNNNLTLKKLSCDQGPIRLQGSGLLNQHALKLHINTLKAPAFHGALNISAPFTSDPWEMDIRADYLNRKAMPEQLPKTNLIADKAWALRANIKNFEWNDARMQDVSIKLASKRNSAGAFKAKSIHSGTLELQHVAALFALPGNGAVDLRHLSADMGEQKFMLSASLTPTSTGAMHWHGFAKIDGNFGNLMQQAELSELFANGKMQALFLGEGILLRDQPWWDGLHGRLRLRVDDGNVLKGDTLSKTLAAVSLVDLPDLFFGKRKDLTTHGLYYKRLQIEASLKNQMFNIHHLVLRSSAFDIAGKGNLNLEKNNINLRMIVRPFQNIDALLRKIPLLRDLLGGSAHSLIRRIYHMHGPIANASVDQISSQEAGLSNPGLIESLFSLPDLWFGKTSPKNAAP